MQYFTLLIYIYLMLIFKTLALISGELCWNLRIGLEAEEALLKPKNSYPNKENNLLSEKKCH